jgi:hypothetical protein
MVKSIRKYNRWFMAGFGVLLMVTWLVGPATRQMGEVQRNRKVGRLDGKGISIGQMNEAGHELETLTAFAPFLTRGLFGIEDRDTAHWLLLTREAEEGGFVGDVQDGAEFADQLADAVLQQELQRNFQLDMQILQSKDQAAERKHIAEILKNQMLNQARVNGLGPDETDRMLARARGVFRMMNAYQRAARVSDRLGATEARKARDAAIVDYVFVPASLSADQIPDPTPEQLQAHFDTYKVFKPGEGEYGIGYLFPERVKLEWMKLDRAAFEKAVTLDPVEVRKRYNRDHPGKYAGEFAAERPNVEKDIVGEAADKAMQDAQLAVHAEVLKATQSLESDGRFKKLPADWDAKRPKMEAVARAVVEQAKAGGLTIPLPEISVKGNQWLTKSDLAGLPGIGTGTVKEGGITIPFDQLVSWTRELPGAQGQQVPIAVQTGVMVAEHPLIDGEGNRYFVTVLDTRKESAPDSVDEKRDQIVKDYKLVRAFEALKVKTEHLRELALAGGLDAVVAEVAPPGSTPPPPPPDPKDPKGRDDKNDKKVEVHKQTTINRDASGGDKNIDDPELRKTLLAAATQIDPMTPYGKADPAKATVVIPTAKKLGVGVFQIQSNSPLTVEAYRRADPTTVQQVVQGELKDEQSPWTMAALLKRHDYRSGDRQIKTPEDLQKDKSREQ